MPTPIFPVQRLVPEELPVELTHVTDHVARAQSRVLTQFKDKARLLKLLEILVRPFQELEDVFWDLYIKRRLDNAEGEQLDQIGRRLLEPRGAMLDEDYRAVLRIKIRVLRSSGRAPELMTICSLLVGSDFRFHEYFPASIAVDLLTNTVNARLVSRFLKRAKSAGVRLDVWSGASPVRFASTVSGGGFGSFASTVSGGGDGGFGGVD